MRNLFIFLIQILMLILNTAKVVGFLVPGCYTRMNPSQLSHCYDFSFFKVNRRDYAIHVKFSNSKCLEEIQTRRHRPVHTSVLMARDSPSSQFEVMKPRNDNENQVSRIRGPKSIYHGIKQLLKVGMICLAGDMISPREMSVDWNVFHPTPAYARSDKPSRPTKDEISNIFSSDYNWDDEIFSPQDFRRLDESSDFLFYTEPRFVEHIDPSAVKALTSYHDKVIINRIEETGRPIDVLDLCSSWVSHVSPSISKQQFPNGEYAINSFVGVGMNKDELLKNQLFTQSFVHDLNGNPKLDELQDNSLDLVLLQLSIDYLTQPINVMREVKRVLRPAGSVIISFSNRLFIEKAVSVWTGKSDLEHMEIVGKYLHFAGGFEEPPTILDITTPSNNLGGTSSDPIYIVQARKK